MSIPLETSDANPVAHTDHAAGETSPLEDLGILQREWRKLILDHLQLAALEVRLAAHSLMAMILAAIFMGVLLLLVWMGLMAATGLSLAGMGLQPVFILLAVTGLTAVLAWLLWHFIVRRSRRLGFPATLRTLKSLTPGTPTTKSK